MKRLARGGGRSGAAGGAARVLFLLAFRGRSGRRRRRGRPAAAPRSAGQGSPAGGGSTRPRMLHLAPVPTGWRDPAAVRAAPPGRPSGEGLEVRGLRGREEDQRGVGVPEARDELGPARVAVDRLRVGRVRPGGDEIEAPALHRPRAPGDGRAVEEDVDHPFEVLRPRRLVEHGFSRKRSARTIRRPLRAQVVQSSTAVSAAQRGSTSPTRRSTTVPVGSAPNGVCSSSAGSYRVAGGSTAPDSRAWDEESVIFARGSYVRSAPGHRRADPARGCYKRVKISRVRAQRQARSRRPGWGRRVAQDCCGWSTRVGASPQRRSSW